MGLYVRTKTFIVFKTWKQPKCSLTDEWIKKWYVYIKNGMLLSYQIE